MTARFERVRFRGSQGTDLVARLDLPATPPCAYALFAHCFTCTKEAVAASRVAAELTGAGIAVLRFDFTGLGGSGGDSANTNFSSNTEDLRLAAGWLRVNRRAPQVLIGHSLGGAAGRYVDDESGRAVTPKARADVVVAETTQGTFLNEVVAGEHRLLADEPVSVGGLGAGPSPYDLLAGALGACTSMTVRMFANRRGIPLERVTVEVHHARVHSTDCEACVDGRGTGDAPRIDRFECRMQLEGELSPADRALLVRIANRCPVHRTLEASSKVVVTDASPDASSLDVGTEAHSTGRRAS